MVKKTLITALLITVLLGGSGCMFKQSPRGTDPSLSAHDLALLHMQEKYGEEFYYAGPWGNSMSGNQEFLVTCHNLPDQPILVHIQDYKSDTPIYKDNYLAVKYCSHLINYFQRSANNIFTDVIVHHKPSKTSISGTLPSDASFEAFYSDPSTFATVYIEIKSSSFTSAQQFDDLFQSLNSSLGHIIVRVIVVEDDIFGTLDSSALNLLPYQGKSVADISAQTVNGRFQYDLSEEG